MWKFLSIFFLTLLCGTPLAYSATLQKVALLARNGARELPTLSDDQVACDACELLDSGKETSIQLGKFLRTRYGDQLGLGAHFDVATVTLRAPQTSRAIITAEAVNKGMYPDSAPLVHYAPEVKDRVLSATKSWPAWVLRDSWKEKLHLDDAWALKELGEDNIATLANFLPPNSRNGLCRTSPSLCSTYIYDVWSVNASEGREEPSLKRLIGAIRKVTTRFMWRLYGIDSKNEVDIGMGPLAGPYVREILKNFASNASRAKLTINVASMPLVFSLYSSLSVFNADNTLTGSAPELPSFGDAIVFEYSKSAANQYIKAYRFTQSATTRSFMDTPLGIKCMNANGVTYLSTATADGCLSEDMLRYVNSLGSVDGQCFVSDAKLKEAGCDSAKAPPAGSPCHFYRSNCPGAQCGPIHGAIADPARGFECQDAQLDKGTPYLTLTSIAIGVATLLIGSAIGFYLVHRIPGCP